MKRRFHLASAIALSIAVALLPAVPASAADAPEQTSGSALIQELSQSPDPQAAFDALGEEQQGQVLELMQPSRVATTSDQAEQRANALARGASCYTYTARSAFYNSMNMALGNTRTTGQVCYSGSTVTSAKFVDGGGSTSFIGWSYVGRTSAAGGVSGGGGYAYGAYKFRLTLVVGFQEPVYCSRAVGTAVAAHADTRCGIG